MHGGQVVMMLAAGLTIMWVVGFIIAKKKKRTSKSWGYIFRPLLWGVQAVVILVIIHLLKKLLGVHQHYRRYYCS
jgi:hypothetical protein